MCGSKNRYMALCQITNVYCDVGRCKLRGSCFRTSEWRCTLHWTPLRDEREHTPMHTQSLESLHTYTSWNTHNCQHYITLQTNTHTEGLCQPLPMWQSPALPSHYCDYSDSLRNCGTPRAHTCTSDQGTPTLHIDFGNFHPESQGTSELKEAVMLGVKRHPFSFLSHLNLSNWCHTT